jgi:hypothetical protein
MRDLALCFGDVNILTDKDTSWSEEGDFQAVHFSWYNRHATTVRIHSLIIVPRLTRNALMSGSWCPNRRTALHARKGWSALQLLSARALRI